MNDAACPQKPVLAGNSLAGVRVLDLLLECWPVEDVLVIVPPETVRHSWQPSLRDAAQRAGVTVIDPPDVNDPEVIDAITSHGADLLLSVYYTQIFKELLLTAVDGLALNFHPALLPRHRGTAPLVWAIAEGDAMAGMSVHEISLGIDTGPIRWQRPLAIHPDDTGYSLHLKASNLAVAIAAEIIRRLRAGRPLPPAVDQSGQATMHTSRDPQLNRIDWAEPAERIRNVVRALSSPLPGAYTSWRGERLGLERVRTALLRGPSRPSGMVQIDASEGICVWTGDGAVALDAVRRDDNVFDGEALDALGILEGEVLS